MNPPANNAVLSSPWVEISLDNVVHNVNQIRGALPPSVGIMAVVKDNAYGCGGVMVSRVLESHNVGHFAVARTVEARALREAGIRSPILVLGPATAEEVRWGAGSRIGFSLNDMADVSAWQSLGCPVRFHLNVDTGMGRLGILPRETAAFAEAVGGRDTLLFEGMYTHLANADSADAGSISQQLARFRTSLAALADKGLRPGIIHYGNSAAVMRYPLEECTLVRPGIALYGCKPNPAREFSLDLKPVMSLKARVIKMKKVPAGTAISYGSTYVTVSETVIATIALGYGQGLPRQLSNRGVVLIRGRRYGIAGRVTMDFIMVDAGANTDMSVGDEVVAIGSQETHCIHPDDVAVLCDTISYEIMCSINPRIDRCFILDGKPVHQETGRTF
jgi:alanine racemase